MEKFSVASWVDIAQIFRSLMNYIRGSVSKPTAETPETKKPAEDVPTNVVTARFTTADEAIYNGNLKGLLSDEDESAIDLLEAQMKSHQVEQFRLMILNMVNPDITKNRIEPILGKDGKPTGARKAVPYTVNHAFTVKDSRILRLQSYAEKILAPVAKKNAGRAILMQAPTPARKKTVAEAIVAKLLKEGSITEKSVSDIAGEKLEGVKQALADGAFDATTFILLGDEHRAIHATGASEATKARRINTALDAKVIAKQAELESWGLKAVFTNKWTRAYGLVVVSGLVYIFFF